MDSRVYEPLGNDLKNIFRSNFISLKPKDLKAFGHVVAQLVVQSTNNAMVKGSNPATARAPKKGK